MKMILELTCRDCNTRHYSDEHHVCPTDIAAVEGKKYDSGKPDLSLLPKEFMELVAQAFMHGEKKYGRYNYLNGMDWHRLVAAALRHITAFNEGENTDAESGLSHLGHAGACLAMLITYQQRNLGNDTRRKAK